MLIDMLKFISNCFLNKYSDECSRIEQYKALYRKDRRF